MRFFSLCFLLIASILSVFDANAKPKKSSKSTTQTKIQQVIPAPTEASIVVDIDDGKILHAENANTRVYPASLTKMMTLYLTFEAINQGKLSMDQMLVASESAVSMLPSKLGLKLGQSISVKDAIMSLIIKSANDSAVLLGEAISGRSERHFAKMMTQRAHELGMHDTTFRNASGWHHPEQKSTAIDMAKLAMALKRDFPEYYPLFSETSFVFNGQTYHTRNRVIKEYEWADGSKTGFHTPAGYNLLTTASKDGKRIVGVVTGCSNKHSRDYKMVSLLDKHLGLPPSASRFSAAVATKAKAPKQNLAKNKAKVHVVKAKSSKKKKLKSKVTSA